MNNTIKLYYKKTGIGNETILFLHGLGGTSESWIYQLEFFKKRYQLIIPDLRGHGKSLLGTEEYSFELCADDIYELLKSLDIKKVHLCGFSFGGMVAFEFAVKYPHMLSSLCVSNCLASFELDSATSRFIYLLRRVAARVLPISWLAFLMAIKLFPDVKYKNLRKQMLEHSAFVNKAGYVKAIDFMQGWNIEKQVSKIDAKTLLIGSEFDYKVFDGKADLSKIMKDARYVEIKGAHHFIIWEYADEFNSVYQSFLDSL